MYGKAKEGNSSSSLPIKRNIISLKREFYNRELNLMSCSGENSDTTINLGVKQRNREEF